MVTLDRIQDRQYEPFENLSDFLPPEEKIQTRKQEQDIISIFEFMEIFPDEPSAIKFMEDSIWGEFPVCGKCGSMNVYRPSGSPPMSHYCRPCKRYFSIRSGTTMTDTNLSIRKWLLAIHLMLTARKGISALQLHKHIGVAYSTSWFLEHRIREAMRESADVLSGIIEVDESFFGPNRNRMHANKRPPPDTPWRADKYTVIGLKSRTTGKIIAFPVPNVFAETLHRAVTENVEPGALIYSDGEMSYRSLPWLGYLHEWVSHSAGEYVRDQVGTNGIESFWAILKRAYIGTYHHMSWKHLHRYVDEASFRHNLGYGNGPVSIGQVLRAMVDRRITYKELIQKEDD